MDNNRNNVEYAVRVHDLVKDYPIFHGNAGRLKRLLLPQAAQETYRALDHVNVDFVRGRRYGLIGLNGSGKSTLSSMISGITQPTTGTLEVNGTVGMLNTSVGLNASLTGRESIYYKCLLLGFTIPEIQGFEQEIVDFADIGMFIDQPLRTYSSGMKARLGFAICTQLRCDILVVDEGLSVGDDSFTSKCEEWMHDFCKRNRTIIFVSHSLPTMRSFCQEVLWLHMGKQIAFGDALPILNEYSDFSRKYKAMSKEQKKKCVPVFPPAPETKQD